MEASAHRPHETVTARSADCFLPVSVSVSVSAMMIVSGCAAGSRRKPPRSCRATRCRCGWRRWASNCCCGCCCCCSTRRCCLPSTYALPVDGVLSYPTLPCFSPTVRGSATGLLPGAVGGQGAAQPGSRARLVLRARGGGRPAAHVEADRLGAYATA